MAQSLTVPGPKGPIYNAFVTVAAAQTDAVVIAAAASRKITVVGCFVNGKDAGASIVTFNSKPAGAGVAITPAFSVSTAGGFVLPQSDGWFETLVGEGLTVTTAAASAVVILVTFRLNG